MLKNSFSFKSTGARKFGSSNPMLLTATQMRKDMGSICESIDVNLSEHIFQYDMENGNWSSDGKTGGNYASDGTAKRLNNDIQRLSEENNMLKVKVEVLLNLVAEIIADSRP